MNTNTMMLTVNSSTPSVRIEDEISREGARLRIISRIERGYGVVPVFEDGAVLLQAGEVAVYKEERPTELVAGLYCLERQRPVALSPFPDSPREIEREVVFVRRCVRRGESGSDSWEYFSLRSRVVRGVRRYARPEGPLYPWALGTLILGPIVGIYSPNLVAGEC